VLAVLFVMPDVATAGAAASLIFLVSFFLAHGIDMLLRRRLGPAQLPFRTPGFPAVPAAGGLACLSLAVFQGVSVPLAGLVALAWLALGAGLYAWRFSFRARTFDASAEAADPELLRSRGRSPLVLVPVDATANAESLVAVANAVSPRGPGRVLLLSVVDPPDHWQAQAPPPAMLETGAVLSGAMTASFASGLAPEALLTVSTSPWHEILRVARTHGCASILLGLHSVADQAGDPALNDLLSTAPCDVVLFRAPSGWRFQETRKILIPIGGRGRHSPLRARLLGSLRRTAVLEATYLCLMLASATDEDLRRARRLLGIRADDEMGGRAQVVVERSSDPAGEVIRRAADCDLVVLGLQQLQARRRMMGDFIVRIARETGCALVILGHKT
jgi:APA family basic amino acid/polyamine antiporter